MRNVKSIINIDNGQDNRGGFVSKGGNTTQLKEKAKCVWNHLTDFALIEVPEESGSEIDHKPHAITNPIKKVLINSYFRIGIRQLDLLQ